MNHNLKFLYLNYLIQFFKTVSQVSTCKYLKIDFLIRIYGCGMRNENFVLAQVPGYKQKAEVPDSRIHNLQIHILQIPELIDWKAGTYAIGFDLLPYT